MLLPRFLLLTAATALLAGCTAGGAFIDRNYAFNNNLEVSKPKPVGYDGAVRVCFDGDTSQAERDRLANEACAEWGLIAVLTNLQPWQCRLLEPHLALYACVDPTMRTGSGKYINPFNAEDVRAWRRRHPDPAR